MPSCFQKMYSVPDAVLFWTSATAGVALVHGACWQWTVVGDGGLPGTTRESDHLKLRTCGMPMVNLTWLNGARQATTTRLRLFGKNTEGPSMVLVSETDLGRTFGVVQLIVPLTLVSPWEYQM